MDPGDGAGFDTIVRTEPWSMPYHFLIVDSSATVRALIKRSIRQSEIGGHGAKFFEAATGLEAMDAFAHHRVDLALIDPRLPDMDGVELIGRILAEPDTRGVPVVAMSARMDQRKTEALRRRGVKGFLRKPFTPEVFVGVVGQILEPTHV